MRTRDEFVWRVPTPLHELLLRLLDQLDAAIDGPTDDPVVQRLFPRAIEDDADADDELRMLLAGELLLERHEAIRTCRAVLQRARRRPGTSTVRIRLVDDEPSLLLQVLNDVRLALGARVGATAVELRQLVEEDDLEAQRALEAMDVLAWCQMQLLEHIDPVAARHDGDPEID